MEESSIILSNPRLILDQLSFLHITLPEEHGHYTIYFTLTRTLFPLLEEVEMSDLPLPVKIDSKRQWRTLAKKNNVEGVNIYNLEDYDSGSKINDPQYLSLRALWKFRPINEFKPCEWGILGVEEARASLMKLEHWADFLQAIPLEVSVEEILPIKHSLGKFELIWYYGQLICCAPSAPDTEENLDFTPLSKRLRERKLKSHGRETSEQTPTHRVV